jgi:protein-arginine kinase activator protein McsA
MKCERCEGVAKVHVAVRCGDGKIVSSHFCEACAEEVRPSIDPEMPVRDKTAWEVQLGELERRIQELLGDEPGYGP